jgi:hypothetical protein
MISEHRYSGTKVRALYPKYAETVKTSRAKVLPEKHLANSERLKDFSIA